MHNKVVGSPERRETKKGGTHTQASLAGANKMQPAGQMSRGKIQSVGSAKKQRQNIDMSDLSGLSNKLLE